MGPGGGAGGDTHSWVPASSRGCTAWSPTRGCHPGVPTSSGGCRRGGLRAAGGEGAGRGGRSCRVPPRRSRSSAAPQPHLPRGRSAQPAVRARRRPPCTVRGSWEPGRGGGSRGGSRGTPAAGASSPAEAPGCLRAAPPVSRESGRAGGLRCKGSPGHRGAGGGGGRARRPPCARAAQALAEPAGGSPPWGGTGSLGLPRPRGSAGPWVPPVPGVPQPPGTPRPGRAPALWSLPPQVAPFPGYFHPPSIPIPGVPPSPAYLPPAVSPAPGYFHPQAPRSLPRPPAKLRSLKMAGLGAGEQAAKWLGAPRRPPRGPARASAAPCRGNVPAPPGGRAGVPAPWGSLVPAGCGCVAAGGGPPRRRVTQPPSARSHRHHDAPIPRADGRAEEGAVGHRSAHRGPGQGHPGRR